MLLKGFPYRLTITALFLSVFLSLNTSTTHARDIKIALAQIPPYAMQDHDGAQGILVDITRAIFKNLGHEARFVFYPWPRAIENMKKGYVHAITPFFKTAERELYSHFPNQGLLDMEIQFYGRADSKLFFNSYEEASAYKFLKVRRANLGEKFASFQSKIALEEVAHTELGIKMLIGKRADIFASVKTIADFKAEKLGLSNKIKPISPILDQLECYLGLSKAALNQKEADEISNEIKRMHMSGEIQSIIYRYRTLKLT